MLPKWRPVRVIFETFAQNLKTSIFDDPFMVSAGPGSQKWEPFRKLFRCFFGTAFFDRLGNTFLSFWAPTGGPMGDHLESKSALLGGPFLRSLFGPNWQRFGEGPAAGAEPV